MSDKNSEVRDLQDSVAKSTNGLAANPPDATRSSCTSSGMSISTPFSFGAHDDPNEQSGPSPRRDRATATGSALTGDMTQDSVVNVTAKDVDSRDLMTGEDSRNTSADTAKASVKNASEGK